MSAAAKLEALLARVQHNRTQPRVARARALSAVQPAAPSPVQLSPTPTPSPAPQSPVVAPPIIAPTSTPTPAPRSPIELPPAALVGMLTAPRVAELGADAVTPPRGLRTPVPPAPVAHTEPAATSAAHRPRQPTPLELAVVDEAEHVRAAPAAATPAAPRAIAASAQLPPSQPIVQIMSEPDAAEPATFGGLLQRSLALRPR